MKLIHTAGVALGVLATLMLGACANSPGSTSSSGTSYPQSSYPANVYAGYGVVQSIELVQQASTGIGGSGIGAGTIIGGVVGGVVGSGDGKTAATVIGAAGGAYAGHELEKRSQQQTNAYRITVRMNDGSYQTLMQSTSADLRAGDRVKIENGVAQRY